MNPDDLLRKVMETCGHTLQCQFKGCTCGRIDDFRQVLGEIARYLRECKLDE